MASTSSGNLIAEAVPRTVEAAIRERVDSRLGSLGIEDVRIEPGEDHDGEPVVYVHLKHRLLDDPIDLANLIGLDRELRDVAWREGERRFVHVRHQYDEKQGVAARK